MIEISRKEQCCGCTACASACPAKCIQMQNDFEGFKYPCVNLAQCANCHECEKVCPVINKPVGKNKPAAFLIRSKNDSILQACTSGGVFTELAIETINKGGIVYGATYDKDYSVCHQRISSLSEIDKLTGSKYVQSDLNETFLLLKRDIMNKKIVAFCGTPCQIAGLKNYLRNDYNNLLLVDLVCHGVPSPKLWRNYLDYQKKKNGELEYINFRSKRLGYHIPVMEERYKKGKIIIGSARTNMMLKCYFKNIADRPICYECPFKTVSRCSDLTIFDGWHANDYGIDHDDGRGYTIVLTHSKKAEDIITNNGNFEIHEINLEKAISLDGRMAVNSVVKPENRGEFYHLLEQEGITKVVQAYFPITILDHAIERIKHYLSYLKLSKFIKDFRDNKLSNSK